MSRALYGTSLSFSFAVRRKKLCRLSTSNNTSLFIQEHDLIVAKLHSCVDTRVFYVDIHFLDVKSLSGICIVQVAYDDWHYFLPMLECVGMHFYCILIDLNRQHKKLQEQDGV